MLSKLGADGLHGPVSDLEVIDAAERSSVARHPYPAMRSEDIEEVDRQTIGRP